MANKQAKGRPRQNFYGQRFGRLIVKTRISTSGPSFWECQCDCGNQTIVMGNSLRSGNTKSCGCYVSEKMTIRGREQATHGHSRLDGKSNRTPEYSTWTSMKQRCQNPNSIGFKNYGGRGISVCDRWKNSFENFFADMGSRPKDYSIERLNNDGNYEPTNCVWASKEVQSKNQRYRNQFSK